MHGQELCVIGVLFYRWKCGWAFYTCGVRCGHLLGSRKWECVRIWESRKKVCFGEVVNWRMMHLYRFSLLTNTIFYWSLNTNAQSDWTVCRQFEWQMQNNINCASIREFGNSRKATDDMTIPVVIQIDEWRRSIFLFTLDASWTSNLPSKMIGGNKVVVANICLIGS